MASSTAAAARSGSPPTISTSARRSASIARIIKSVVGPAALTARLTSRSASARFPRWRLISALTLRRIAVSIPSIGPSRPALAKCSASSSRPSRTKLGGDLTEDVGAPVSVAERSHQCGAVESELDRLLEATVVLERLAEVRVGPPKIRLRALLGDSHRLGQALDGIGSLSGDIEVAPERVQRVSLLGACPRGAGDRDRLLTAGARLAGAPVQHQDSRLGREHPSSFGRRRLGRQQVDSLAQDLDRLLGVAREPEELSEPLADEA